MVQPECPSTGEQIRKTWHQHTRTGKMAQWKKCSLPKHGDPGSDPQSPCKAGHSIFITLVLLQHDGKWREDENLVSQHTQRSTGDSGSSKVKVRSNIQRYSSDFHMCTQWHMDTMKCVYLHTTMHTHTHTQKQVKYVGGLRIWAHGRVTCLAFVKLGFSPPHHTTTKMTRSHSTSQAVLELTI